MKVGLVGGEGFAVDASVVEADAILGRINAQRLRTGQLEDEDWSR